MTEKQLELINKKRSEASLLGNPVLRPQSFRLLNAIATALQPKRILEVGTNTGLSGISMLLSSEGSLLDTIEIDEDKVREAKANYKEFDVADRVRVFIGDASEVVPMITAKYDLIFIDGPKGHYYEYLLSLEKQLNKGGIIFADNILYKGYIKGLLKVPHRDSTIYHSMQNYIKFFENNKDFKHIIVDIEDGVSLAVKV